MSIIGNYPVNNAVGSQCGELKVTSSGLFTVFSCTFDTVPEEVCFLTCTSGSELVTLGVPVPQDGGLVFSRKFSNSDLKSKHLTSIDSCWLTPKDKIPSVQNATQEPEAKVKETEKKTEEIQEVMEKVTEDVSEAPSQEKTQEKPKKESQEEPKKDTPPASKPSSDWQPEPDPGRHIDDEEMKSCLSGIEGALVSYADFSILLALPYVPGGPFPLMPAFRLGRLARIKGKSYIVFRIRNGMPY